MIKKVSEKIKNEAEKQKARFFSILLVTLCLTLLGNLLTGKGVKIKIPGQRVKRAGEGAIKASQDFNVVSSFN